MMQKKVKQQETMDHTVHKTIELENKLTLNIFDLSRKISEDAYRVTMKAQIDMDVTEAFFTDPSLKDIGFSDVVSVLGNTVSYVQTIERNFIMAENKDAVFEKLVDTFMDNLGQYIAKPRFPAKLIFKKYTDTLKKRGRH